MEPKYNLTRLASSAAIKATPGNIKAVLLFGGSAATSLKLTDDANGAGTAVLNFNVPATESRLFCLEELGGVIFPTKIYGTLAGTAGEAYVWWE